MAADNTRPRASMANQCDRMGSRCRQTTGFRRQLLLERQLLLGDAFMYELRPQDTADQPPRPMWTQLVRGRELTNASSSILTSAARS